MKKQKNLTLSDLRNKFDTCIQSGSIPYIPAGEVVIQI